MGFDISGKYVRAYYFALVFCAILIAFAPSTITYAKTATVSQGPNFAGTDSNTDWASASSATGANDNSCAAAVGSNSASIDLTNFSFSSFPAGSTISGILVEPKAGNDGSNGFSAQLLKAGSAVGSAKSWTPVSGLCPSSTFQSLGGNSDLWGTTWTITDIVTNTFGVRINRAGLCFPCVLDAVRITVYYDVLPLYVNAGTGSDAANPCTNSGSPCKSITHAHSVANAGATINIAAGTYSAAATSETLPITITHDNLNFAGANSATTILSSGSSNRFFDAGGLTVNFSNMTIRDGSVSSGGSAMNWSSPSTVTLTSLIFTNNTGGGSAIYDGGGSLSIYSSSFISNSGGSGCCGGGINMLGSTLYITGSTFSNNHSGTGQGGAIAAQSGDTTIRNSTFNNNISSDRSGAIDYTSSGSMSIYNSTFDGNSSGTSTGVMASYGPTLTIGASTFSNNHAVNGIGALYTESNATITNTTFYSNTSDGGPSAALYVAGRGTALTNVTISANETGNVGGVIVNAGVVTITNSILANDPGTNCGGSVTNGGNNIETSVSCGWGTNNGSKSDTNPKLWPFTNLGGPTKVLGLLFGSPAIDGVTFNSPNGAPSTDQRGFPRPVNGVYDVGAVEMSPTGYYFPFVAK